MESRTEKLRALLEDGESALITDDADRFYFTGFHSSAGVVFITKHAAYFLIDFRYFEKAQKVVKAFNVILATDVKRQLKEIILHEKTEKVYVLTERISLAEFASFNKIFEGRLSDSDRLDKMITKLRQVKDSEEIAFIKHAQSFTDDTFNYILEHIQAGRTEREVMLDMEFYMRRLGSEGVSFDFIVVSGKNSSLPHGVPTDKKIEAGDFVTMDFGAVYNGYRSDMTRTVAVEHVSDKQRAVYDIVLRAQMMALSEISPGKICRDIDAVARNYINNRGYEGCFGHGLGHSVGIEIHENPSFNTRCSAALVPGMVMTVEPGIYIENSFGVRIEDMIVVTEDGCDNITESDKSLIVL